MTGIGCVYEALFTGRQEAWGDGISHDVVLEANGLARLRIGQGLNVPHYPTILPLATCRARSASTFVLLIESVRDPDCSQFQSPLPGGKLTS